MRNRVARLDVCLLEEMACEPRSCHSICVELRLTTIRYSTTLAFTALSEEFVLERHIILWLKADTSPHNIDESTPLLGQRVHDGRAGRRERSLEHVAQHAQDRVEALPLFLLAMLAPLDPREELGDEHQVDDER